MKKLNEIISIANNHGFRAELDRTETLVFIYIPFSSPDGGGYDREQVGTVKECYFALGY